MQLFEHQCYWTNKGYPEDRLFVIFILTSILLYFVIVVLAKNTQFESEASVPSQAPNQAVRVSIDLLRSQQATNSVKTAPIPKKVKQQKSEPKKKKVRQVDQSKSKKPPVKSPGVLPVKQSATPQLATAPKRAANVLRGTDEQFVAIKQHYFSELLTHIETYKYYPQSARRRGLSGAIDISFRLFGDGQIKGLTVHGGPVLLQRAAKKSVQQALPMPLPPSAIATPMQVSLIMQYQLH